MATMLHLLVALHAIVLGHLHGHRVWVTTFDGEAWKSGPDAVRHLVRSLT